GFEVAIVGAPKAGKSTRLNALAGREAAITSEIAGTTRDVIEVRMDLGGLAVTILDTAGLRETDDYVEGIGVRRAVERARLADLRVFLTEGNDLPLLDAMPDDIIVRAKADLRKGSDDLLGVSGVSREGLSELMSIISERLSKRALSAGLITRDRHRQAVVLAIGAMESGANELLSGHERSELAAENLRQAVRALDTLVGRVDVEHLLDEIFSSFCIGK
ncbi:MAG: GTPase, partial [Albidovulum sp.]